MLSLRLIEVSVLFEVIFYFNRQGKSEVLDFLDNLSIKSQTSKTDSINREKILTYISALQKYGTRIGRPYVKHIENELWELRPLKNRIFFFYWKNNKFVLLLY